MRTLALAFGTLLVAATMVVAGPEPISSGKEIQQVAPAPCPQWYADNEWNITLWGAYAFGGDDGKSIDENDFEFVDGESVHFDSIIGGDAGGGGIDVKYFFHKYFGIGIEGYGLATNHDNHIDPALENNGISSHDLDDDDGVFALKGTFTLRFPIGCSRFAPYIFGGGGAIWGGQHEHFDFVGVEERFVHHNDGDDVHGLGQVGGGFEVRFTPHIGWITDVSWNFTDDDDFGMVRGGINFAF